MKFHSALSALALACSCAAAQAVQVINFDDIAFPGGNPLAVANLAPGYQGLEWGGEQGVGSWNVSPNDATGWFGGTLQPYSHSGNVFAWANGAGRLDLSVRGGGTFDVVSLWARIWPNSSATMVARGYLNGTQTFTQSFGATQNYALITLNFTHIDRLVFDRQTSNLLLDDITINNVVAVPEPASALLLSLGMLGLMARGLALSRRRAISR